MKITPKFSKEDIKKLAAARAERIIQAAINELDFVGLHFIKDVRDGGTYTDRTGNLRSSTGYVILRDGKQLVEGGFELVIGPERGLTEKQKASLAQFSGATAEILKNDLQKQIADGAEKGRQFVDEMATQFPTGLVIIGVAGMDYAAAVESRGYDVITSGSLKAADSLKKGLEALKKQVAEL